jgi:hypothetical protein
MSLGSVKPTRTWRCLWIGTWNVLSLYRPGASNIKLEDQGQGQRFLEAITRVGQDPAWVVAPVWMNG